MRVLETDDLHTPKVMSAEWFNTVTLGDIIKVGFFVGGIVISFTKLSDGLTREAEMRMLFEGATKETVMQIRSNQAENSARWDARFTESSSRDRESAQEMKSQMSRLNDKLDAILQQRRMEAGK